MAGVEGYVFVPADRETTLPDLTGQSLNGPMSDGLRNQNNRGGLRSRKASDINSLFMLLKAEEEQVAVGFLRDPSAGAERPTPKLTQIETLWRVVFPDRRFSMATRSPMVRWTHADRPTTEYPAAEMSDGEKSVLYLTARVMYAPAGVIVIDEPEVHLHPLLARRFWDAVESARPDCRFVYVTHDLAFALSRRDARLVIVNSPTEATLLPEDSGIPDDLFAEIVGAASLSVLARRIVFCEGVDDGSIDRPFYEAWFSVLETAVAPVGSCGAVRQSVEVFKTSPVISSAQALGIVERDFWPEDFLSELEANGFFVLKVHELEGLLCLRPVVDAVGAHLNKADMLTVWSAIELAARKQMREPIITERAKRRVDLALEGLANGAKAHRDRTVARQKFIDVIDLVRKVPDAGVWFDEEAAVVDAAATGSWDDVLRVLPSKSIFGAVAHALGVTKEVYQGLVVGALTDPGAYPALAPAIEGALQGHLPARD